MTVKNNYIKSNFEKLILSNEYKSTLQLRGGKSGHTNWLNIDNEAVGAIEEVLTNLEEYKRMKILLKAAKEILTKCDDSTIVQDVFEVTTVWDNVECDGYCLFDEIKELTLINS